MATTGQQILDRARYKANDQDTTKRWTDAEALLWINDGQREVVNVLPRANTVRAIATAASGTRQTLTGMGLTTGLQFIDVVRNYDSAGTTPGSSVTKCKRSDLDDKYRDWHSRLETEAKHWMADDEDPTAVYIWPAISGGGKLEVLYSALPTDLASLASNIALADIYANAIQYFLMSSFYQKDGQKSGGVQRATMYYQLFMESLGVRSKNLSGAQVKSDAKQAGAI